MLSASASDITKITAAKTAADPAQMLRAQLNRFASPFAPSGFRLFRDPLPLDGPVDGTVALRAGAVMIDRLVKQEFDDPHGFGLDFTTEKLAGQLTGDVTGKITRDNLSLVTGIVAGYADVNGLPKPIIGWLDTLTASPVLRYAGALGVLLGAGVSFWKRRRA
jgi:hypothetical protein